MSLRAAQRRARADRKVFVERLASTAKSRVRVSRELSRIGPGWFIGSGLLAGLFVGGLPARAVGGLIGAMAAFSLRLLSTPLGPAAFGALMARRSGREVGRDDHRVASVSDSRR